MDYIHNNYPLDNTKKILDFIASAKYFTIEQALSQTTGEMYSIGIRAKNGGNPIITKKCIECLNLIQPYLSERQASSIDQYIELLY